MKINIPIETYRRLLEAVRILEKIILNYHLIDTKGKLSLNSTKDLDAARKIVAEINATYHRALS